MSFKRILAFSCWLFFACLLVIGCNQANTPKSATTNSTTAQTTTLTISAAASLKDALDAIKPIYNQSNPSLNLVYNFGSSGALQQQIEQGAKVDVFISAATKQIDALAKKGLLVDGTKKDLLKNQLVLIAPQKSTNISSFQDLTSPQIKKIALGEPKSVPAGHYAQQVLTSLKLADKLKGKVVYAKDVRQALNYVESGNVDAGLVYLSDAKSSSKVKVVTTAPENIHSPIIYPIAVIKSSKNINDAKDFEQFLFINNEARNIFEKYGFVLAGK
ncbi:molybdate ABC transporter substrate-binding protein [Nostoc sp. FACHB-280]|uniref:molybdate ABC transporter substrate-binding protein n=1 Tax=Nostoc sp. FACHB-280 TaxID=2692839 RepID=UPI00168B16DA|nr:molybdate ABC transporter substrate-binding protein [Nostoc sp. FACHB-280]MBD2494862.1 molybdate ABC transporter substrate-binding protein [Nostoc sp. FACHB-280]